MTKYIIKNCPMIHYCAPCKKYHCGESTLIGDDNFSSQCEQNTEKICLLKQVVEKCKDVQEEFYDSVHSRYLSPSKAKFAKEILQLLDIEEVENE